MMIIHGFYVLGLLFRGKKVIKKEGVWGRDGVDPQYDGGSSHTGYLLVALGRERGRKWEERRERERFKKQQLIQM